MTNEEQNNEGTNTMNKQKKQIIDLVNKIRREVTEEQMSVLAGDATSSGDKEFVDWHEKIDDLTLGTSSSGARSWLNGDQLAQLRALLHRMADLTGWVGGRLVSIGKRAVKFLFELIKRYPATVKATLVMAVIAFLVAHIPLLGLVLAPIVHAVAMGIVGFIFIVESVRNLNALNLGNL